MNITLITRHSGLIIGMLIGFSTILLTLEQGTQTSKNSPPSAAFIMPPAGSPMQLIKIGFAGNGNPGEILAQYADLANASFKYEDGQIVQIACEMALQPGETKPRTLLARFVKQQSCYKGDPVYKTIDGRYGDGSLWIKGRLTSPTTFEETEFYPNGRTKSVSAYFWYEKLWAEDNSRWRVRCRQVFDAEGFQTEGWNMEDIANLRWWVRDRSGNLKRFEMPQSRVQITEWDYCPGCQTPFQKIEFALDSTILWLYDEKGEVTASYMYGEDGGIIATKWQMGQPLFNQKFELDYRTSTLEHKVYILDDVLQLAPYDERGFLRVFLRADGKPSSIVISHQRDLDDAQISAFLPPPSLTHDLDGTPCKDHGRTVWTFNTSGRASLYEVYSFGGDCSYTFDMTQHQPHVAPVITDYPPINPEFLQYPDFPPRPGRPEEPEKGFPVFNWEN